MVNAISFTDWVYLRNRFPQIWAAGPQEVQHRLNLGSGADVLPTHVESNFVAPKNTALFLVCCSFQHEYIWIWQLCVFLNEHLCWGLKGQKSTNGTGMGLVHCFWGVPELDPHRTQIRTWLDLLDGLPMYRQLLAHAQLCFSSNL